MREFVQDAVACHKLALHSFLLSFLFFGWGQGKRKHTRSRKEVGLFAGITPAGCSVVPIGHPCALTFTPVIKKELCLGGGEEKATEIDNLIITDSTVGDGNTMH